MTRPLVLVLLLVLWHSPASAQPAWVCGSGTVHSIEAIDEAVTRETIATQRGSDGRLETFVTRTDTQHRRSYVLAVQLGDVLYTSESGDDPFGTFNPLRIVAGERIQVCASARQMIVDGLDGTDYRAPVVSRATAPRSETVECRRSTQASSSACR